MTDAVSTAWTAWTPPGRHIRTLQGPDGRSMDLMFYLPEGEAPANGWPLLLALDGGRFFDALTGAAAALAHRTGKTGVAAMAIAALAHRPGDGLLEDQRARDFTRRPCSEPGWTRPSRGGEALHRLIADRVLPLLAATAPVDLNRATLFGHSLAGLFVLETLEADPGLFARWASVSPSLWWSTPSPQIAGPSLLVGCGEAELARDMRDRIAAWVGDRGEAGTVYRLAPGADHGSAPFALIPDILRHASGTGQA
jgi:predicted alpha/beta superfamily hydrolase